MRFYLSRWLINNILDIQQIDSRICLIRIKLKFYNLILAAVHVPIEDKDDLVKENFYILEDVCDWISSYDMKSILDVF